MGYTAGAMNWSSEYGGRRGRNSMKVLLSHFQPPVVESDTLSPHPIRQRSDGPSLPRISVQARLHADECL